ncbi:MAG: glutamate racemase [Chloroflexi bacterium]|nr:glutamate racemase [Chloroflexota bacterium]MBP7041336.1 glutamate racemase [Chloroflexota bacterium]
MENKAASPNPIGIFDSGVGGLSVLNELRRLLPQENLLYVADQAHVPYGSRPLDEIRRFSEAITHFLLAHKAKLVVVACNTASAAALTHLRNTFPIVPFVGMEPAVKPAARQTQSGRVGVLATATTFASERYADLMARYAREVVVWEDPCRGLVGLIESGEVNTPMTMALLRNILDPMLASGVDTLVLGCTHYPFVIPLLRQISGPEVMIIDPAPAIARQVERVLQQHKNLASLPAVGEVRLFTTGAADLFTEQVRGLLGMSERGETAVWRQNENELVLQSAQV